MKAVQIESPGKISHIEAQIPKPPPGFVRIKVKAAAICATDLEIIDATIPARYPLIPGHEWSGIVDEAADEGDKSWLGKRVIGSNDVVCLRCEACRSGNWRYCSDFEEIGFKRDGACAEYMIVPAYGLCELADSVSFAQGALAEPLAVALGTLEKAGAKFADTLLIMGAGSIGLCLLAVGRAMGLRRIVVCAKTKGRLEIARQMGAAAVIATDEQDIFEEMKVIHPDGTDVVIDATGITSCIQDALKLVRPGGSIALAGYGRGKIMPIRVDDIHINNLHLTGAGNNWNKHRLAAILMAEGQINIENLISQTISLDQYDEGIAWARQRPDGFVKAVITF